MWIMVWKMRKQENRVKMKKNEANNDFIKIWLWQMKIEQVLNQFNIIKTAFSSQCNYLAITYRFSK